MTIGSRIKELREAANLTQDELAKKVGVTKSAIGNYEQNISSPKESVLYNLIDALDCDANYICELPRLTLRLEVGASCFNHYSL